ncbi:hypothetical protein L211DRAFT_874880 [Terfezia boudieri ATCC MYA-4762]|uniref:Uncharacterized protein n=1 Tax=Terfezia boudieri ATCC MYA-4762 TaxID=1051890 RepID=A0A3N4L9G7_9PEZI|nr:hypothetical protein L211DRAFT_874880 [Terfezia boudieri ATCC MYA-4762]
MTPYFREKLQQSLGYLGSKIVQYRVIDPNSLGVKELRSNKRVKPRSQKQIQGVRSLDRAYIEEEKARIAAAAAEKAEKAANREARRLAIEQKEKEAKKRAEALKKARGGTKATRGRGRGNIARSRTARRSKYEAEGADMHRLETAMSFLSLCGMYAKSTLRHKSKLLEAEAVVVVEVIVKSRVG